MFWKWFWKILTFLLVLTIFVGGGIAIYRTGYIHGVSTGSLTAEGGREITPPGIIPHPGLYYRPYRRPLLMFPVFGLFFGFILLVFLFGGIGRLVRYGMWKSAGMPYPKDWRKYHPSHYWGHHPWVWDKAPPEDERSGQDESESESDG